MNFTPIKKYSLALASVLALGVISCSAPQDEIIEIVAPPAKNIPAVNAPKANYNFYKPASEEGLKKDTNYGYLIAKTRPNFKTGHFERLGLKVVGRFEVNGASYYRLHKEDGVLEALEGLNRISSVMFAEPELLYKFYASESTAPAPISAPMSAPVSAFAAFGDNTDYFVQNRMQWGAFTTRAYDAWTTYGFGPHKAVVAAVDGGVQYNHEDLKDVVKHAYTWFSADGWDYHEDTWDFEPEDFYTWNPVDARVTYPNGWGTDLSAGHGTHTAGTICGAGNNGIGVAGMCWNVDFISYAGFGASQGVQSNWTIMGSLWHLVRWKQENNYNYTIPVNFSLGSANASRVEIDMIEYALQHDVMVIAAAGNDYFRMQAYPASYAGVLAVGASNGADRRSSFSNYGPHLSVVAPGEGIVSTWGIGRTYDAADSPYKNRYEIWDGTSMATPHVTGLAAYMLTFNPDLKPHEIKTYIERYADYIDGATGFTEETGWGRINVLNTIKAVIDDKNAGRKIASEYASAPVIIKAPPSLDNMGVFLYRCNEDGSIQNYVASSITGYEFAEEGGEREKGVANFNMLRPGRYIAHIHLMGIGLVGSSEPFEVAAGQDTPLEVGVTLEGEVLFVQTFPTQDIFDSGFINMGDTVVGLYDSGGNEIVVLDWYYYDTLAVPSLPVGDYYIHVIEFEGDSQLGEYGLWVNSGLDPSVLWGEGADEIYETISGKVHPVAPGTFANPTDGVKSAQAQTRAAAMPIDLMTIYYGRFNGDAADGGTSGATGHWYKVTFTPQQ